jgi:hypothetical protein
MPPAACTHSPRCSLACSRGKRKRRHEQAEGRAGEETKNGSTGGKTRIHTLSRTRLR